MSFWYGHVKIGTFLKHFTLHKKIICTPIVVKSACPFRIVCKAVPCEKVKIVVLLVRQLQHCFTKNAKVSPNFTVAHVGLQQNTGKGDMACMKPDDD